MEKLIICSIIVQFTTERIKPLIPEKAQSKIIPFMTMAIGILIAFLTQENLFESIKINVISMPTTIILTGIAYSGGSGAVHKLIQLINENRPTQKQKAINENVIYDDEYAEDDNND